MWHRTWVLLASYLVTPQQIAAAGAQLSEKPPTRASASVQDPSEYCAVPLSQS